MAIGNGALNTDNNQIVLGNTAITSVFINGVAGQYTNGAGVQVLIGSDGKLGTIPSSRRYKDDIQDMGVASKALLRLRPVTFHYKKPSADGLKPIQYGLIAEEVAEVYPELVARGSDGQIETVQYYKLDVMLLNEVQRLTREQSADQEEIERLKAQLVDVKRQLDNLNDGAAADHTSRDIVRVAFCASRTLTREPSGSYQAKVRSEAAPPIMASLGAVCNIVPNVMVGNCTMARSNVASSSMSGDILPGEIAIRVAGRKAPLEVVHLRTDSLFRRNPVWKGTPRPSAGSQCSPTRPSIQSSVTESQLDCALE